jgi:serine/threonine protein kinase
MQAAQIPMRRIIGRYAVLDKIASGGMASIHLGRLMGDQGFSRVVAIKRLHAVYAEDPALVAKFIDEARLAARVRHPNVVTALDVVSGEGLLAVVLEYVHGETLAAMAKALRVSRTTAPNRIALSIAVGMLEGLHAAHEATGPGGQPLGIVHRDVSPQNVIVGVDGVARVLDFGVAKATRLMDQTRGKSLKGKVAYMAPEQLSGDFVDRRSDVYSASVVLWELLTGERLFEAPNDAALMQQVLQKQVPSPTSVNAEVPQGLSAIVLRGLARDPRARHPTARQMATGLESIMQPAAARDVGRWVESVAGAPLVARSNLVAMLESATTTEISALASVPEPPDDLEDATIPYDDKTVPYTAPPIEGEPGIHAKNRDETRTVPFTRPEVEHDDTAATLVRNTLRMRLQFVLDRVGEPTALAWGIVTFAVVLCVIIVAVARC